MTFVLLTERLRDIVATPPPRILAKLFR